MSYAELIETLHTLPTAQQSEVYDFVKFLANKNLAYHCKEKTLAESSLAELVQNPLVVAGFTPFSREEANVR